MFASESDIKKFHKLKQSVWKLVRFQPKKQQQQKLDHVKAFEFLELYEKVTMDLNNGLTWIKVIFNVIVKKHSIL